MPERQARLLFPRVSVSCWVRGWTLLADLTDISGGFLQKKRKKRAQDLIFRLEFMRYEEILRRRFERGTLGWYRLDFGDGAAMVFRAYVSGMDLLPVSQVGQVEGRHLRLRPMGSATYYDEYMEQVSLCPWVSRGL